MKNTKSNATGSGAEAVAASFQAQGVETIFGVVGAAILPIFDVLQNNPGPRQIIAAHEHGAVHMAEGYARASGRTGVVLTSSGPSATNIITGLANAMADSVPLLAVTGQVPTNLMGQDSSQEADMYGLSMPVTKHSFQPQTSAQIADILQRAFVLCQQGRPGPVLIDLPQDLSMAGPVPLYPAEPAVRETEDFQARLPEALNMLRQAHRPLLLAGGGLIRGNAAAECRALAETLQIPVVSSLMGLGCMPARHPLFLGMVGVYGLDAANLALRHSDLLLCLGSRLDDRITGKFSSAPLEAKLIHLDIDAAELGKNYPVDLPLTGQAKTILKELLEMAGKQSLATQNWLAQIKHWQERFPLSYTARDGVIMPQRLVQEVARRLKAEDIIVTGVGQNQMFTAQYYPFSEPRTLITSGGLGAMGFGLPAAIGAKLAQPKRQVVCLDGDGSFLMTLQELSTAVRYRVPVIVAVMKNHTLGMIQPESFYGERRNQNFLSPPPYDKVAEAFGALGRRVELPEDLGPCLDWAMRSAAEQRLPVVLDVVVANQDARRPPLPEEALQTAGILI